ncbi:uncharacterized protein L203_102138 [Cryptococcus depauperatus CBS 7841]|uniref:Alpha/beta hydrolase fold-3 domain-containing protein n=1 Tax=Cryptococcus depauperatus CBS 7841 TaxID=1295531 RepID=A0AAJ8JR92_9TREE
MFTKYSNAFSICIYDPGGMTGFGTPSVALAVIPTAIAIFCSHLLSRRPRKHTSQKPLESGGPGSGPEDQLSYEEGLQIVRQFLEFASHHGIEELQGFTAMWVPTPHWAKRDQVVVPESNIRDAEEILAKHLVQYGPDGKEGGGLKLVGGEKWWKVRRRPLAGEWVEMQKDYLRRTTKAVKESSQNLAQPATVRWNNVKHLPRRLNTIGNIVDNSGRKVLSDRVILYIHGGAFFFSSLETHRYQVQRHVRKAGARAFCPAYRLSPQYPFPCGLLDCLASYLFLISPPKDMLYEPILPTNIVLMGDSAGAGMIISLLVVIREMGLPMPAGASLVSPWVDLTHSMPSIGGWDGGDFIPSSGFHYKPSCAWPPLPGDGIDIDMSDGTKKHCQEQIQMYCPNNLLTHPLVSPINQGSLGGLCPLLIIGGGAELLRDEIVYIAHKAADPTQYPPAMAILDQYPDQLAKIEKYKPTKVHLQIYEGCCHVVPTLSWTRSSKYMYRACANFNIWAFNAARDALETKLCQKQSRNSLKKERSMSSFKSPIRTAKLTKLAHLAPLSVSDLPASNLGPSAVSPSAMSLSASSNSSSPNISSSSSRPITLDLTQPIIATTAADDANIRPIGPDEMQSEAESETVSVLSSSIDSTPKDVNCTSPKCIVTVNGSEPLFGKVNLVSERISAHGSIRPLESIEEIPALQPELRERIGQVHGDGAIRKWLAKRAEWDRKYSSELKKWRRIRIEDWAKAEKEGFLTRDLQGERPPLCSVAGIYNTKLAGDAARSVDEVTSRNFALALWSKWGSKADKVHEDRQKLREMKSRTEKDSRIQAEKNGQVEGNIEDGQ